MQAMHKKERMPETKLPSRSKRHPTKFVFFAF